MSAARLAGLLSWVLDFIALVALAGAGEQLGWTLAAVAPVGIMIACGLKTRIPKRLLPGVILIVIVSAISAWLGLRASAVLVAAHAAPVLHLIVWLMPEQYRKRSLRLAMGLIELILASSVSTEFYLFIMIFGFVVVGAVAASCEYLASQALELRAPQRARDPLPRGFAPRILGLSFCIFLCGLIIFPLLPRLKWEGGMSLDISRIGYTEEVTLNDRLKMIGSSQMSYPILWFYTRSGVDLGLEIFQGLIRGRALDRFDGLHWSALEGNRERAPIQIRRESEKGAVDVEAVRDPLGSAVLPVPYGTISVESPAMGASQFAQGGEWTDSVQPAGERGIYSFKFLPYQLHPLDQLKQDMPLPVHTFIPPVLKTERMERLVRSLFTRAPGVRDKIEAITQYLHTSGFKASEGERSDDLIRLTPVAQRLHPIERFLFLGREGHCEWFASSTALLLRMGGVPTRLIAGFRMSHSTVGGVLTVHSSDAHAWVEYWDPDRGWMPFDPTPRILVAPSWTSLVRDGYEWVSGYWYRYILMFSWKSTPLARLALGSRSSTTLANLKDSGQKAAHWVTEHSHWVALGFVLFVITGFAARALLLWRYPWIASIRHRVREGAPALSRERRRVERFLRKRYSPEIADALDGEALSLAHPGCDKDCGCALALRAWKDRYDQLRFGRSDEPASEEVRGLRERFEGLVRVAGRRRA